MPGPCRSRAAWGRRCSRWRASSSKPWWRPAAPTAPPPCAAPSRPPRRSCAAARRLHASTATWRMLWPAWARRGQTGTIAMLRVRFVLQKLACWLACCRMAPRLPQRASVCSRVASLRPPALPACCRSAAAGAGARGGGRRGGACQRGGAPCLHGPGKRTAASVVLAWCSHAWPALLPAPLACVLTLLSCARCCACGAV